MTNAEGSTAAGTASVKPQGVAVTPASDKGATKGSHKKAAPKAKTVEKPRREDRPGQPEGDHHEAD